jgi:hypothetical protein
MLMGNQRERFEEMFPPLSSLPARMTSEGADAREGSAAPPIGRDSLAGETVLNSARQTCPFALAILFCAANKPPAARANLSNLNPRRPHRPVAHTHTCEQHNCLHRSRQSHHAAKPAAPLYQKRKSDIWILRFNMETIAEELGSLAAHDGQDSAEEERDCPSPRAVGDDADAQVTLAHTHRRMFRRKKSEKSYTQRVDQQTWQNLVTLLGNEEEARRRENVWGNDGGTCTPRASSPDGGGAVAVDATGQRNHPQPQQNQQNLEGTTSTREAMVSTLSNVMDILDDDSLAASRERFSRDFDRLIDTTVSTIKMESTADDDYMFDSAASAMSLDELTESLVPRWDCTSTSHSCRIELTPHSACKRAWFGDSTLEPKSVFFTLGFEIKPLLSQTGQLVPRYAPAESQDHRG